MSDAPVDLAATPVRVWKSKLGALSSHYVGEDDPRVKEVRAALTYWRMVKITDREVEAGHMRREFADAFTSKLRFYTPQNVGGLTPDNAESPISASAGAVSS